MEPIRILHIEDDLQTIEYCKKVFETNPRIQYLAGFNNLEKAIEFISNNKVDLLFCDIEMPIHNGLWVAHHLPYQLPVVFVTAHAGFAVEAFEACALHYLIKPFGAQQLQQVIDRYDKMELKTPALKEQVSELYQNYISTDKKSYPNRVYISNIGKIVIVDLSQVLYLEGVINYTKFVMLSTEEHVSTKNLKNYTDALANHPNFVRIHRSYLVNKNYIKQIHKSANKIWFAEMQNGTKLELAKNRLDEILELLQ